MSGPSPSLGATLALVCLFYAQPSTAAEVAAKEPDADPALTIGQGSVVRRQIVALGRDLVMQGEARADVAVLNGTAHITGSIGGDLIVLGGEASLGPEARIAGDVFVLGGTIQGSPGTLIEGRSVAYPTAPSTWLVLLEGPSLGLSSFSPFVVGTKLALVAAWMATALLLLSASAPQLLGTAESVRREPFRSFAVGLTAVLTLVLTLLFFSAFTVPLVAVPLVALVVLLALIAKLWGMVAVFYAVGWVLMAKLGRRALPLSATLLGLLLLAVVKLIPWAGTWVWTVATLIGVGASLTTKFGRREPWFELDPDPSYALLHHRR